MSIDGDAGNEEGYGDQGGIAAQLTVAYAGAFQVA
jgi:hypothetical protein